MVQCAVIYEIDHDIIAGTYKHRLVEIKLCHGYRIFGGSKHCWMAEILGHLILILVNPDPDNLRKM